MVKARDIIHEIEEVEESAASAFSPTRQNQPFTDEDMQFAFKRLLRLTPSGTEDSELHDWGCWAHDVPLMDQLLMHPQLIVDLQCCPEAEFPLRYGVTPQQFAILVSERLVIPNIYDYVSQKEHDFVGYNHHYLERLLPQIQHQARINAIRREKFFVCCLSDYDSLCGEGTDLFHDGLASLSDDEREKCTRGRDLQSALVRVSANWAYLGILGARDRYAIHFVDAIRNNPPRTPSGTLTEIGLLDALKFRVATQYTAAFGGAALIHPHRYEHMGFAINQHWMSGSTTVAGTPEIIAESARLCVQFFRDIGIRGAGLAGAPKVTNDQHSLLSDTDFHNLVAFLKEYRPILEKTDRFARNLLDLAKKRGDVITTAQDYVRVLRDYEADADRLCKRLSIAKSACKVATSALAAALGSYLALKNIDIKMLPWVVGSSQALWATVAELADRIDFGPRGSTAYNKISPDWQRLQRWQPR